MAQFNVLHCFSYLVHVPAVLVYTMRSRTACRRQQMRRCFISQPTTHQPCCWCCTWVVCDWLCSLAQLQQAITCSSRMVQDPWSLRWRFATVSHVPYRAETCSSHPQNTARSPFLHAFSSSGTSGHSTHIWASNCKLIASRWPIVGG